MQDGISVFRIDYEIRSKEDGEAKLWSACIAAYGQEQALKYLGNFLGKTFKTIQFERRSRLDAISDEVRQKIIDAYLADIAEPVQKDEPEEKEEVKVKEVGKKEPTKRGKSIIKK
jgi:hypothetical protein